MIDRTIESLLQAAEPTAARRLGELVERLGAGAVLGTEAATGTVAVRGVTQDSSRVRPGSLFVAIAGTRVDGHDYVGDAQQRGASAVLVERRVPDVRIPQVIVPSTRRALAEAAAWWYGDPSRQLAVIGVTGTDGKTTTSLMVAGVLEAAGIPAGLLGTVATQIGGTREGNSVHSTTPEAPALQRAMRAMIQAGDRAAIVETTSHGLALDRVAAIAYDVAILTNLTHEHLDLHGTFEAYRAAKRTLFERLGAAGRGVDPGGLAWPPTGIVNADDPSAEEFMAATRAAGANLLTFGRAAAADVRLISVMPEASGIRVRYRDPDGSAALRLSVTGTFNAYNALAAVALGLAAGLDGPTVRSALEQFAGVPGRMELIEHGQPFDVVVDYAHSPASLTLVLDELAQRATARGGGVIVVFGSAGERDRDKRPMMGRRAAERCRIVILADEDPRGEDRSAILEDIAGGIEAPSAGARRRTSGDGLEALLLIPDREEAIHEALARARPGDVVLLAGKGHETTIEYADHVLAWNERRVAEAALAELGWGS